MKPILTATKSCRVALPLLAISILSAVSQPTLNWRSESLNSNWNDANNWWNGVATQSPPGSEILRFGNAVQLTMVNNLSGTPTNRYRIYFDSGSGARTVSGTAANFFYDFGGNTPLIQNDSGNAQSLGFPIVNANAAGSSLDIVANSGALTLSGTISASGAARTIYPQGAANITLSGIISDGPSAVLSVNKPSGSGDLKLSAVNTYSGTTTISAGSVTIDSISTYSSSITGSATGKGNVTIGDGVGIGAGSGKTWYVPTLTLQGTTMLTTANRLNVGISTLDLSGGTRIVNVNGKSGIIFTSGGTSTINGNSENTGLCQWEINNNTSGTSQPNSLTVQNGTLDLEATGSSWTGGNGGTYGMFRINGANTTSFTGNGSLVVGNKVAFWVNNSFVAANAPALTISSGGYVNALDNDLTVYSLAGGGTYSLSLVVANSSTLSVTRTLTLNGAAGSADFSGTLQNGPGAGAELKVTKSGAATQTFSGANTYSGLTTVSAGTLKLGNATALGAGTFARRNGAAATAAGPGSTTIASGAVLDLNGQAVADEALSIAGTGISSSGAIVNNAVGAASIAGGGVSAVALTASGSWTSGTLSGPPAVTVNNAGTGGSGLAMTAVVGIGSVSLASGGSGYSGAPAVTVSGGGGSGAVVSAIMTGSSPNQSVSSLLIVNPGSGYTSLPSISFASGAASASVTSLGVVALNISSFGSGYTSAPTISIDNTSWSSGATATATVPAATMTAATSVGGTGPLTIGLPLQGSFGLTKVGVNTVTLSGANSFAGDTTLSAGTLRLGAGGVIPDGSGKGNVVMNPAAGTATFDVNGQTETVNGLSNSGAGASVVENSSGTGSLTVGANNATFTFGGVIQNTAGSLALTKSGSGTMTLSGASTYSGGTTLSGGTALAGVSSVTSGATVTSGPFGTGNLTLNDGVTLASSSSAGRSIAAPVINVAGNITLGQASGGTGRLSIDGTWDLGGGARTVTLGKASSGYASGLEVFRFEQLAGFTVPTVHNGSLVLATTTGSAATPSIARILNTTSFSNNTALTLGDGVAMSCGTGSFFGTGANSPSLILGADAGRGGGVFQMGDATSGGNAVVRVAEVYSLAGGGTVSAANSSGAAATGTLTINHGGGAVFSGAITETGGTGKIALLKLGVGTQTFSGSINHSGNTTISGGTLALSGSATMSSTPVITLLSNATFDVAGLSSAYALGAGQALKGQGSVIGASVLNGSLEPGTSVGTLTFSAPPALAGIAVMEINQSAAQTADNVVVSSGTLNYGGALIITNIGALVTNGTFTLFSAPGYSGAFSSVTVPAGGTKHWLTNNLSVDGTVTFTNNRPVANALTAGVALGGSITLPVIGSKNGATDADADLLTVTAVGAPTSGSVSFGASNVTYVASGSLGTNTFTYAIADEVGATSSNTVTVLVSDPLGFNQVSAGVDGGNAVLTYLGIPGTNYALEITHDLPATNWLPVITNAAAANGFLNFTNPISLAPTNDYYRTRYLP